jgi:integrase
VVSPYYLHHVQPHGNAAPGSPVFVDRISKAFTDARILAGIADERAPTFHELRSLSKRLYDKQGGVDTQQLLGHASEKTAAIYADARGVEAVMVRVA